MTTIPKIIHYCWFGNRKLPDSAKKCIESWKKYYPDVKIKQWNESNFDFSCCSYVKEASEARKWAFVSDYARFWILYNYGGIYFDTDVELIKSIDHILNRGPFMACENKQSINPGLGIAAPAGLKIYKEILDYYSTQHFLFKDGIENDETIVTRVTKIFKDKGFKGTNNIEKVAGVAIYPTKYFCPLNYKTGKLDIQRDTVAIHHYTASWHSRLDNIVGSIENNEKIKNLRLRRIISLPFRIINKWKKTGTRNVVRVIINKITFMRY